MNVFVPLFLFYILKQQISQLMKKLIVTLITLTAVILTACSQQQASKFEQQLNEFKYSLYEYMDTIPFEILRDMDAHTFGKIQPKIDSFLTVHKNDIYNYKINTLNTYKNNNLPDLQNYESTQYISDYEGFQEYFNTYFKEVATMYSLYTIDVMQYVRFFLSAYDGRVGVKHIASQAIKDQFAMPRIITRNEGKDAWTIFVDKYRNIFEFSYNINDNILLLKKIYSRKPQP